MQFSIHLQEQSEPNGMYGKGRSWYICEPCLEHQGGPKSEGGIYLFSFRNAVESMEVHTEAKRAILFLDKENGCTMQRTGGLNEAKSKMFIQEVSESF